MVLARLVLGVVLTLVGFIILSAASGFAWTALGVLVLALGVVSLFHWWDHVR